jgi:hypothetical protein
MDLTQDQMNFTQDQLDFIAKIIDAKIQAISASKKKQLLPPKEFHSLPEIRELILLNLDHFRNEFDYEPFRMQAVIHCLRKLMVLRPADLEILGEGKFRLDMQISGAIRTWDQSPFVVGEDCIHHLYWRA